MTSSSRPSKERGGRREGEGGRERGGRKEREGGREGRKGREGGKEGEDEEGEEQKRGRGMRKMAGSMKEWRGDGWMREGRDDEVRDGGRMRSERWVTEAGVCRRRVPKEPATAGVQAEYLGIDDFVEDDEVRIGLYRNSGL